MKSKPKNISVSCSNEKEKLAVNMTECKKIENMDEAEIKQLILKLRASIVTMQHTQELADYKFLRKMLLVDKKSKLDYFG